MKKKTLKLQKKVSHAEFHYSKFSLPMPVAVTQSARIQLVQLNLSFRHHFLIAFTILPQAIDHLIVCFITSVQSNLIEMEANVIG